MRKSASPLTITILLGVLFAPAGGVAQGYRSRLVGQTRDSRGAVVARARVTATNLETGVSATALSDEEGNFVVPLLIPGRYRVTVEAAGFKTFRAAEVLIELDQVARVDAMLEVGGVGESIEVDDEGQVINTETATEDEVIRRREIVDIPLNGRNYLSLTLLAPGVSPAPAGANPFHINGTRSDHVNYLIDGVANIDRRGNAPVVTPPLDAIREFKVITSTFSAEHGRLDGGVVSVALMSGSNSFHGTLFEFHRNDVFDARGFFDRDVPKLTRNQFGGVLGGPVAKNKAFFFAGYEGLRHRDGQTRLARVPTADERRGVFPSPIRNPFTRAPFPNNAVPQSLFSPVARNLLPLIPLPNRDGALNYFAEQTAREDSDSWLAKLDFHMDDASQLFGRFLLNDLSAASPFRSTALIGFGSTRRTRQQQWSLTYARTFTAAVLNEARAGYTRSTFAEHSVNAGKNTSAQVGITGVASGYGLASLVIAGLPEIGDATFLPDEWTDNEYLLSDTLSVFKGAHNLRLGGEFQRSQHFNLFSSFAGGQIAFLGAFSGSPFADFLLGLPVQTSRQVGTNKSYLFSNYWGVYAQDDWRVFENLTLNLGLRYDRNAPPIEKYDRWANFIPSERRQVRAGEAGYPRALVETDKNNIAPRLGFAYRPFGGADTAVRGGYGIYYGFDLQFTMYQLLGATAFPFTRLELYQAVAVGNPSLSDPFPAARAAQNPGASSPNGWDYENPTPYTQSWSLSLSHQLTDDLGVEVSYVGTKGTHLSVLRNLNQTVRTPGGNLVPLPGLGRVLLQSLGGNSSYNALQLSVQKRFGGGLVFRSAFTWAKAIDNATFSAASRLPQNPLDVAAERGRSEFDRRRVWTGDFIYELPFGRERAFGSGANGVLDALFGGWQVNGILRAYDGLPFTPVVSTANAQAGFAMRPDRLRSGEVERKSVERWFDATAFRVVPASEFRFGNSGRNILTGPGALVVDASLCKEFRSPLEGHRVQFRIEAFNLPNRANFALPDARVDQPTAGVIGSAGAGRQVQFALKYIF